MDAPHSRDAPYSRTRVLILGAALVVATLLAYARVTGHGFVTFDDYEYIRDNPHVRAGLTWEGLRWAFTTGHASNWHPLTWLSHMLDCQLFDMRPAGHHLTSVALHVLNTLLLLYLLTRTTGAIGPSAFVAATFALHPLHVESVAWVAERKDVLCALFWILTLLAYVRWVERPSPARYALALLLYTLGLLSKPMIVTLPFTLLLVDLWPLRRFEFSRTAREPNTASKDRVTVLRLVREKIPFFALALALSVTTYFVQRAAGAMEGGQTTPFYVRAESAAVAYVSYLSKSILPLDLAAFYPFAAYPLWEIAGSALLLLVLTAVAVRNVRDRPWLAVGWLWFLGTLVPVIGFVRVGLQAFADRYTYVPMIGLSVAVAWSVRDLTSRFQGWRIAVTAAAVLTIASWTALTWNQVGYWKDNVTFYSIAKKRFRGTYRMHGEMGNEYLRLGRLDEALVELRRAVELKPDFAEAHNDLGIVHELQGRKEEAIAEYREALRWKPDFAEAHHDLAGILAAEGKTDEAIEHYRLALELRPDLAEDHYFLGILLLARGQSDEGIAHLRRAVELAPGDAKAQKALDRALALQGEAQPK